MEAYWLEGSFLRRITTQQVRLVTGNVSCTLCEADLPHVWPFLCNKGRALDLDFHLEGAPNWRAPREESLNVYGVAQPTLPGLKGILSVLGCRPPSRASLAQTGQDHVEEPREKSSTIDHSAVTMRRMSLDDTKRSGWLDSEQDNGATQGRCVWFCTREEPISTFSSFNRVGHLIDPCINASVYISGRPFVLRDIAAAKTTMTLSDRAENLEGIERRLRDDMLLESKK